MKRMVFLEGKQGVCFDIPTASVTEEQEKWNDSWRLEPFCGHRATRDRRTTGAISQRGKAVEASGDSPRTTKVSGDSGKEVKASEDNNQEVATKVTDSKTKARSGVLIKHSDRNLK